MRWVTYVAEDGSDRVGLVVGDAIHGLGAGETMEALLGAGVMDAAAERARFAPNEVRPVAGARLRGPLRPVQLRDFMTFLQHLRNAKGAPDAELEEIWNEAPPFYFSNAAAVIGPHDPVPIPPGCQWFDFELEVAAVVGRAGRDLDPDAAFGCIAGFTIMCDWSARDLQFHEAAFGFGPVKGKDGATTLGPALVTIDELAGFLTGRKLALGMHAWVNGEQQLTDGSLGEMDWDWGEMLAYASRGATLVPGDVIGSGTVPLGCLLEHAQVRRDEFRGWLQAGDVVRLDVEGLGSIEQTVVTSTAVVHPLRERG